MRHFTLFFLLLLIGHFVSFAQSNSIISAENQRFEAMVKQDTVFLFAALAPDLHYIHSNGLEETRKQHVEAITSGKIVYKKFERVSEVEVRSLARHVALLNGVVLVEGTFDQNPFSVKLRYTSIYRRENRRSPWKLLNWQSTRI